LEEKPGKTFKIGCVGCLLYIVLFFTVGGLLILAGFDYYIILSVVILSIFALFWFTVLWWARRADKRDKEGNWWEQK
jgi:heme A synthase